MIKALVQKTTCYHCGKGCEQEVIPPSDKSFFVDLPGFFLFYKYLFPLLPRPSSVFRVPPPDYISWSFPSLSLLLPSLSLFLLYSYHCTPYFLFFSLLSSLLPSLSSPFSFPLLLFLSPSLPSSLLSLLHINIHLLKIISPTYYIKN